MRINTCVCSYSQDDWFFGAEFRLEGQQLLTEGTELRDDFRSLAAEIAVKVKNIEGDFESFARERREEIDRERVAFEASIEDYNAKAKLAIDQRLQELGRFLENK
jgi:hypothetical protein